ncbi:MAG: GNAT family N-acetyltransferase [Eubacteriales bacterium]|nr:GNAT family N-acetyltransferase [Eubacteriales bacterium]
MTIQLLPSTSVQNALDLVRRVFLQFEAPEYPPEGVETFCTFLENSGEISKLRFYGAFEKDVLIGTLATRGEDGSHIALFFVETVWQGQGAGRELFTEARRNCSCNRMTVNASPYAKTIYEHLGFTAVTDEQLQDGIRFIPMVYTV